MTARFLLSATSLVAWTLLVASAWGADQAVPLPPEIQAALRRAGENRPAIEEALERVPEAQRAGMEFLVRHMPERDLQSLSASFLLDNLRYAYRAWEQVPWKDQVPRQVFFNNVLVTKDDRFDTNDHLVAILDAGKTYRAELQADPKPVELEFNAVKMARPLTFVVFDQGAAESEATRTPAADHALETSGATRRASGDGAAREKSQQAVEALRTFLAGPVGQRPALAEQAFAAVPLTAEDARRAHELLWQDHVQRIRTERAAEMEARELSHGDLKMPFYYKVFGEAPAGGRSLYISMHGGGGAPAPVNDQQWENQKRLYQLKEGVYVAPRAPTNTWNLWHQAHIDPLFGRLIENMIVFENVDPNRVYLMGYSAGGDGVYQLAPRMADRLAAAAMMAGHPNETSPLGLRNLPFTIHVGGKDSGYNRNKIAADWKEKLAELHANDPDGYHHLVKIYPDKGHWMDHEDAAAIPWMAAFAREPLPLRIVWKQDDVVHQRFYWLHADREDIEGRAEVVASRKDQQIELAATGVSRLTVRLNDRMLDLDRPVTIRRADAEPSSKPLFEGIVPRTLRTLARTLHERADPASNFSAEVTVDMATED